MADDIALDLPDDRAHAVVGDLTGRADDDHAAVAADAFARVRPGAHAALLLPTVDPDVVVCCWEDAGWAVRDLGWWVRTDGTRRQWALLRAPMSDSAVRNVIVHGTGAVNLNATKVVLDRPDPDGGDVKVWGDPDAAASDAETELLRLLDRSTPDDPVESHQMDVGTRQPANIVTFSDNDPALEVFRVAGDDTTARMVRWLTDLVLPPGGRLLSPYRTGERPTERSQTGR